MNFEEFDEYQMHLLTQVINMSSTKGKEYTNSETNRFANFDRLAAALDMTNAQIGWVYCAKHLDSITSFIRTGQTFSTESIEGRFVDAITYLTLIAGMIHETRLLQKQANTAQALTGQSDLQRGGLQSLSEMQRRTKEALATYQKAKAEEKIHGNDTSSGSL